MTAFVIAGSLMALALLGMVFVEFVFVCAVCIGMGTVLFYIFLIFAKIADKIIDLLYVAR